MNAPSPDDELRAKFESLASDPSHQFRRSRKGTYVNGATARDWKWFLIGFSIAMAAMGLTACGGGGDEDPNDPDIRHPPEVSTPGPGLPAACIPDPKVCQ